MKHYKLRTHLTWAFAVIAIIPVLVLGAMQIKQIYDFTRQNNITQMNATQRLADAVETYVQYRRNAVETLATTISASRTPYRDRPGITLKLDSVHQSLAGFRNLYVTGRDGIVTAASPETDAARQSLIGADLGRDADQSSAANGPKTVISPLFLGREGGKDPIVAITTPLYSEEGRHDGYVVGILDIRQLEQLVVKYDYGPDAYPVVLDGRGRPVYHPDETRVQSLTDLSEEPAARQAVQERTGTGKFHSAVYGRDELVTYRAVDSLNWTVWVARSYGSVNAAFMQTLTSAAALLLLTLIVTIALGSYLAKRLNGTIHELVDYSDRLANNDFAAPQQRNGIGSRGSPYELNLLADRFFRMAEQISEHRQALLSLNAGLEQRVEERTRQNEQLLRSVRQEHATLQAVLESMSDAIVLVDDAKQVVYANRRLADIFGIPAASLAELDEERLFRAIADRRISPEEENGAPMFQIRTQDGKEKYIYGATFFVSGENGVFGRGYVWRDMTKEHEVDRLKTDLISLASHEFKTPLTSIRGNVETLLRPDAAWEEEFKRELLEGIREDTAIIQRLIEEWLDISRIEAGMLHIQRGPARLSPIVQNAWKRLPHDLTDDATLRLELDDQLPIIDADKSRLEQVFVNLFANGIRYNAGRPVIRVTAAANGASIAVRVQDNGIGISEEHLGRIFDRFYRIDVSSSRQTGGTGLGLAICKGIMEAHGGAITVESTVGKGSVFTVTVPVYDMNAGES